MAKSDDDSHATASLNGEETPRLSDSIDLETADYKTLLSIPQIGAKRAMGIMTMRTCSRLSIFNVSETTGLKEEVISRLISSGRIADLPKHVEGMESLEAQPDTSDLEEIRNNLTKMTNRMAAMEGCVTELRLANTNLTEKLEVANNPARVEQAITQAVEGCMPAIAGCTQATHLNEQGLDRVNASISDIHTQLSQMRAKTEQDRLQLDESMKRDFSFYAKDIALMQSSMTRHEERYDQRQLSAGEQDEKFLSTCEQFDQRWADIQITLRSHEETLKQAVTSTSTLREQFQAHLQACRCSNKASLEEGESRTKGDDLSSTDSGARQGMEYESPSFGTSAAASTVRILNDLEEEKADRHDNNHPGWMKDLMGKVPTDNIYVRPTRPTQDLHSNLHYGEEARRETKLETGLQSDTLPTKGASGISRGLPRKSLGKKSFDYFSSDNDENRFTRPSREPINDERGNNRGIYKPRSDTGEYGQQSRFAYGLGARSKFAEQHNATEYVRHEDASFDRKHSMLLSDPANDNRSRSTRKQERSTSEMGRQESDRSSGRRHQTTSRDRTSGYRRSRQRDTSSSTESSSSSDSDTDSVG